MTMLFAGPAPELDGDGDATPNVDDAVGFDVAAHVDVAVVWVAAVNVALFEAVEVAAGVAEAVCVDDAALVLVADVLAVADTLAVVDDDVVAVVLCETAAVPDDDALADTVVAGLAEGVTTLDGDVVPTADGDELNESLAAGVGVTALVGAELVLVVGVADAPSAVPVSVGVVEAVDVALGAAGLGDG